MEEKPLIKPFKIVIIGPESTGKSTLCTQLADHYKTIWVKEYAREYLLTHGTNYTFDNLLDIAKGQLNLEDAQTKQFHYSGDGEQDYSKPFSARHPVFIDTDLYVLKVWCEFVFDQCHHWILNQIAERNYDLYLLCNVDLPWTKDELREYPDLTTREKLYHHYKDIMINQQVQWVSISGGYAQRLQTAITAIDKLLHV